MATLHPDDVRERDDDFEVTETFLALYSGSCAIDNRHDVRRGSRVGRIRAIANPLIPIPGVACSSCVKELPRARR